MATAAEQAALAARKEARTEQARTDRDRLASIYDPVPRGKGRPRTIEPTAPRQPKPRRGSSNITEWF